MKLTFILLFAGCLTVSATGLSQTVTLNEKNVPLEKIFKEIRKQTGLNFLFSSQELRQATPVTIQVQNANVHDVLKICLKGQPFTYTIENGTIVVKQQKKIKMNEDPELIAPLRTITGKITNSENNEPIAGANIICKEDPKTATVSNKDGSFSITINDNCKTLLVSYVGFSKREIALATNGTIFISLTPRSEGLGSVVVTGYTTTDKRLSASAVSTVNGSDLERSDFLTVDQMLQGKVPGLNINITSTTPGAAPKIRLRGTATLMGNREPIWVVDGIVVNPPVKVLAQDINSVDNLNLLTSAIIGVNPSDIERIDVLKDASSTALYGVSGANGVIVITTKRGRFNQKMNINYSSSIVLGSAPTYDNLPIMNSKERLDVSREIVDRGLNYRVGQPRAGFEGVYQDYKDRLITFDEYERRANYFETMNTNWLDLLFRNSFSQTHNISFSSGSASSSFYASLGYANQNSSAIFNNSKRYSGLFKFNSQLSKNLMIGLRMSGAVNTSETPFGIELYNYAYKTSRALPYEENGERYFYTNDYIVGSNFADNIASGYNIMTELEGSRRKNDVRTIDVGADLEWKFIKNFRFKGTYGYTSSHTQGVNYATEETDYAATNFRDGIRSGIDIPVSLRGNVITPRGGFYSEGNTILNAYTIRNSVDYNGSIKEHNFSVLLGSEFRSTVYNTTNSYRLGYMPDRGLIFYQPNINDYPLFYSILSSGNSYAPITLGNKVVRYASIYGIASYAFKNRYIFNFNFRNDGSNRFGTDINNRFLPTFSSAFRWVISDEKWFERTNNLNLLAFRVSYGFNGNIPETESPKLIITQPSINNVTGDDNSFVVSYPNSQLRWEKTNTLNAGLEFALFKNRITGEIDAYYKRGEDLISKLDVAAINGVNSISLNGAGIENKGFEVTLNTVPIRTKNWSWNLGVNFGRNYSKTLKATFTEITPGIVSQDASFYFGVNTFLYGNKIAEGIDPNTMYAYQFTGLNSSGLPTFKGILSSDYSAKPGITDYFNYIFKPMGSRIPKFDGNFNSSVRYKNWSLNTVFIVKLGYVQRLPFLYNNSSNMIPSVNENFSKEFVNRWRQTGDEAFTNIPVLTDRSTTLSTSTSATFSVPYTISNSLWNVYNFSDIRVADASHLRLSSLSIQYRILPEKKKLLFNNAAIRLQGNDLFVIANKAFNGRDPETRPTTLGRLPSYNLSINVGF